MDGFSPKEALIERIYWLVRLRWIAVAGVGLTVFIASKFLGLALAVFPLYAVTVFLGAYNMVFAFFSSLIKGKESVSILNRLANAQICLDLLSLTMLLHFSGSIENPFIFYFVFHMIIAGILLSRRATFLQASFAVALFSSMAVLEYRGIIPHYSLKNFAGNSGHISFTYLTGVFFAFASTIYIAAYMANSISRKLRRREKALEEANALLKEKDRLKSEYVLRVSHDIKEHLAAIQGCLEPVSGGITGELNSRQLDLIQRAINRTAKLTAFVRALLEITRMKQSKEMEMGQFSLNGLIFEAIAHTSVKANGKNISVNAHIEPAVDIIRGSREYIQETVVNILANAIKYTPPGGKVDIYVSDKGNGVLIQIKDTGIGIPKEELPKVFDEFYRASNAKQVERDGTGLGLSIAKQIIKMHNGKIYAESEEGKGSTFNIELPK